MGAFRYANHGLPLALSAILVVGCSRSSEATGVSGPPSSSRSGSPEEVTSQALVRPQSPDASCTGTFSNDAGIDVANPAYLQDVPGDQLFCDFHTFAWNQFIWLIQMQPDPNNGDQTTPLFLHLAPWNNLLKLSDEPPPSAYPGGSTALQVTDLDQAGDDDQLVDVAGRTVLYDIRFNKEMYDAIAGFDGTVAMYTQELYEQACQADPDGNCTVPIWLPPTVASPQGAAGSMEVKTAWRDFGAPTACPSSVFYCNGRFGLVGVHVAQKTQTHGEWIWSSFEHVDNVPDCYPGGDQPIVPTGPTGNPWSFFNPSTAEPNVMSSQICEVTSKTGTPQCNGNPNPSGDKKTYVQVNLCRANQLPAGGASAANCAVVPDGPPQQESNSPGNVACLNATLMRALSGVWKNYKMIGSLWVRGETGPTEDLRVQIFQDPPSATSTKFGEPVGFPHLANATMETWLQRGSTGYDPFGANHSNSYQAGCFLCHNLPSNADAADFSHFPNKLQPEKHTALLKSLTAATSEKPHVPLRTLFSEKRVPLTSPKRVAP